MSLLNFFVNVSEKVNAVSAASTTTIDFTAGTYVTLSQSANITTFNFSNPASSGLGFSFTLVRTKDNSGTTRTIAWPASVKWAAATAPTLTQTANAVDVFTFITSDGGTTWYGFTAGLNMS